MLGHDHIVKMLLYISSLLSTLGHGLDKLSIYIMMTKEGSTKIVNSWAVVLLLRFAKVWPYETLISSTLSIYSTLTFPMPLSILYIPKWGQ